MFVKLDIYIISAIFFLLIGIPYYMGWRFVRAMERRNTASQVLQRLNDEARALREQASLLSQELGELAELHGTGRLLDRTSEHIARNDQ